MQIQDCKLGVDLQFIPLTDRIGTLTLVIGLACLNDPESYAGDSLCSYGRATQAGQVEEYGKGQTRFDPNPESCNLLLDLDLDLDLGLGLPLVLDNYFRLYIFRFLKHPPLQKYIHIIGLNQRQTQ